MTVADELLSIGDVARRAGVAVSALRYYEARGLIRAENRVAGRRAFTPGVLTRLALIARAQQAGFTLAEVGQLLSGFDRGEPPPRAWRELVDRKARELDEHEQRIRTARGILEAVRACRCATLDECVPSRDDAR